MKVRPSVKKMCSDCNITTGKFQGKKRVRIRCKKNPKHNQRQG